MKRYATKFLFLLFATWSHVGLAADAYVVANAPANASLDDESLMALLRGQRRNWDDGNAATVVLPSRESDDFELVAQRLFGASGRVMQRLWFRVVFSGRANAPEYVDGSAEVLESVAQNSGAVGILFSESQPEVSSPLRVVKLK